MTYDYTEWTENSARVDDESAIKRLQALAQEQLDMEARIARLQAELQEATSTYNDVRLYKIPRLMDQLEMTSYVTSGGMTIKMKDEIRGSIPKAQEEQAHQWLEENDHGNLIKRQITIEFGRDEESWARKFLRDCARRKKPLNMKRKNSVHVSTLKSFVKGQLEDGIDFPMALFGVFRQQFSSVKAPD